MAYQRLRNGKLPKPSFANVGTPSKTDDVVAALSSEGEEATGTPVQLEHKIAESIMTRIREVTSLSLGYDDARITSTQIDKNRILLSISLPFLSAPDSRIQEWPYSRRDLKKFVEFLRDKQNQKLLSNFFHKQLVEFLIKQHSLQKFSEPLRTLLKRSAQRSLAGRPAQTFTPRESRYIASQGKTIQHVIQELQTRVREMKRRKRDLTHPALIASLEREYSQFRYPWIKHFFEIAEHLPRRRYSSGRVAESDFTVGASSSGKLSTCRVSEPDEWSTSDIAAKILKKMLFSESGNSYPLLKIKELIRSF